MGGLWSLGVPSLILWPLSSVGLSFLSWDGGWQSQPSAGWRMEVKDSGGKEAERESPCAQVCLEGGLKAPLLFVPGIPGQGGKQLRWAVHEDQAGMAVEEEMAGALCPGKVGKNHQPPPYATVEASVEVSSLMCMGCAWPWAVGSLSWRKLCPKGTVAMGWDVRK